MKNGPVWVSGDRKMFQSPTGFQPSASVMAMAASYHQGGRIQQQFGGEKARLNQMNFLLAKKKEQELKQQQMQDSQKGTMA